MKSFEPCLRFLAMSDVHIESNPKRERMKNFEAGLSCAMSYAMRQEYNRVDAVCVNGDFSQCGEENQMQLFALSLRKKLLPQTKVILTLASHEFMCEGGESAALERFKRIFGLQPDTHSIINGFHFIAVSTTNGCHFSSEKREWIKAQLAAAAEDDPFRPIFFFQHPHISGTVYGSVNWGEDEITDILMNYPQIVDFSGHSHAPVNDPRSVHQQHFTCAGTGSFSYFELDEFDKVYGTVPPEPSPAAQFLIVEADKNGTVVIKPFDVHTQRFFNCEYIVEKPWEPSLFKYTDERYFNAPKPFFAPEAKLLIEVNGSEASLTFTQAKIEKDRVNDYKITVRRKGDNAVIRQLCVWSRYYLNDMPDEITQAVESLESGEYTVSVRARGFWHNVSTNTLDGSFTVE